MDVVYHSKSVYIPKLTEPTWVPRSPTFINKTTSVKKSITRFQFALPILLEWSMTNDTSSKQPEQRNIQH